MDMKISKEHWRSSASVKRSRASHLSCPTLQALQGCMTHLTSRAFECFRSFWVPFGSLLDPLQASVEPSWAQNRSTVPPIARASPLEPNSHMDRYQTWNQPKLLILQSHHNHMRDIRHIYIYILLFILIFSVKRIPIRAIPGCWKAYNSKVSGLPCHAHVAPTGPRRPHVFGSRCPALQGPPAHSVPPPFPMQKVQTHCFSSLKTWSPAALRWPRSAHSAEPPWSLWALAV